MIVLKLVGFAVLAAAMFAGSAKAQAPAAAPAEDDTKPVWSAFVEGDNAAISFSVPDSDDTRFIVLCENKKRSISMTVYDEVKGMKVKRPLTIEMSAGTQKASIKGNTTTDELNGFVFGEANKVPAGPLLAVLREPGDLTIKMGKASVTFPAEGRAEQLKIFEKGCKAK